MLFKKGVLIFSVLLMLFNATGCRNDTTKNTDVNILKISAEPLTTPLYYTGVIKPLQTYVVNNVDAQGYIINKYFEYGDKIKKDQLLFIIVSQQLVTDLQTALTNYVKAKKSYADNEFQMQGSEELKKLNIISLQEYNNSKTQLFNANLDLAQSYRHLQIVLQQLGIPFDVLNKIDNSNPDATNKFLEHALTNIQKKAPIAGVALLPESDASDNNKTRLTVGSQVKPGQTLLLIGDMSGVSIDVKVTEININKIILGQKVTITSDALPGISFLGHVSHVDQQGETDNDTGLPAFSVTIVAPNLKPEILKDLRVGMRARAEIQIMKNQVIKIPIDSVINKDGKSYVKLHDPHSNQIKEVEIKTGNTGIDYVEVASGLNVGDEIVTNATSH